MFGQTSLYPAFVGRKQHVAALLRLLETARAGRGQLALISGEAGIGKTRLVRELVAVAHEQGWTILEGHCFPQDHLCVFAPFLDLLRTHFTQRPDELVAFGQELSPLVPDLLPIPSGTETSLSLDPEQEKRRRFAALTRLFIQQAVEQPLLLVIEDIHWSDGVSLESALHPDAPALQPPDTSGADLSRGRECGGPAAMACPTRAGATRPGDRVDSSGARRSGGDVTMRCFCWIVPCVPTSSKRSLRLTEGNPFFIEEAVNALIAGGEIFYHDGAWDRRPLAEIRIPRTIYDAVQRGAAQVTDAARQVLTLAAIVGRRFDFDLLLSLARTPRSPADRGAQGAHCGAAHRRRVR